jgi:hypothetical protein
MAKDKNATAIATSFLKAAIAELAPIISDDDKQEVWHTVDLEQLLAVIAAGGVADNMHISVKTIELQRFAERALAPAGDSGSAASGS